MTGPTAALLDGPLTALRESEIRLLGDIAATLGEAGENAQEDRQRLLEVAQDLRELFFLVVVIGEFNAGKSSFINALLGDELLPTGITPTTELIELIRYADVPSRKPQMRQDSLREWQHPNTGAPGVSIVDTPGTGSVFQKHEQTARAFLHRSDLVIFVISAKRAFAETERMYLEMAQSYGKKIILVINQTDLLKPSEQAEVRRFVESQVKELLGIQPLIFNVSAKESLAARKSGVADTSGMDAVRAHLRGVFSEAPPAKQKLLSQLDMTQRITQTHFESIREKAEAVNADTFKARELQSELGQQAVGLSGQLQTARADVDKLFDGIRQRGLALIDSQFKLGKAPNRDALQKEFQEVVVGRAVREVSDATNNYVNAVIDHSRQYWRSVIDRLNQLRRMLEQEVVGLDAGVYAEQRESLEEAIRIAEGELRTYSSGEIAGDLQVRFQTNVSGFAWSTVAAAGGATAAILAFLTHGPIIGSAFPLVAPAFFIGLPVAVAGGVFSIVYFRRINAQAKKEFNARMDTLVTTYHDAMDDLIRKERNRLAAYGNQILTPIFSRLQVLSERYSNQQAALQRHQEQLAALKRGIEESK